MKHQWKLDEYGKPDEWAWESGFHNGVYCERCGKTVCIHCDSDWELMDDCIEPPKPKPQTNADRIRAMSDEELAVFLECFGCCHYCSEHERLSDNRWFSDERCDEKCAEHCLEWLKQPVED